LNADVVVAAVERLLIRLADEQIAVDMAVVVGGVDAVGGTVGAQVLDEDTRRLRAGSVMNLPYLHVLDDEWVSLVPSDSGDALAEVETVQAIAMGLVVLEADERQGADVRGPARAIGLLDRQCEVEGAAARCLKTVAVAVVLAGDVVRESVQAVGPPEAGA